MRGPVAGRMRYPLVEQADGDAYLEAGNLVLVNGQLRFGSGEDVNLYRGAADQLSSDDTFNVNRGAAADTALQARVTGDGTARFAVAADGKLEWGSGAGARDVNLYRSGANALRTDDSLNVAGSVILDAAGFASLVEIADPTAPVANVAKLYARDNGAGKTQIVARFATGVVQVIATEP